MNLGGPYKSICAHVSRLGAAGHSRICKCRDDTVHDGEQAVASYLTHNTFGICPVGNNDKLMAN